MGIAPDVKPRTEQYRQTVFAARKPLWSSYQGTLDRPLSLTLRAERRGQTFGGTKMGRGILLWLLGVPIPIIILLALIWH
jgi:hypothetical protein